MIFVSISSTEEKFVIELKHKIDYVVERNFGKLKSLNKSTVYMFFQLFFGTAKMIFKEIFGRSR